MPTGVSPFLIRGVVSVVVVGVAATAAFVLSPAQSLGSGDSDSVVVPGASGVDVPEALVDSFFAATAPQRIRTCHVEPPGTIPGQRELFAAVVLPESGEVLWQVEGGSPTVPASVLKLVTAQAAVRVLGPDFRFTTRIVEGSTPGELWLVGGGDPTLSRTSPTSTTYYTNPARVSDLVDQVGVFLEESDSSPGVTTLGVDGTRYAGFPPWHDSWRAEAARLGFVAPVTALMVDGGRVSPGERLSARVSDPVSQAVSSVVSLLGQKTGSWGVDVVDGVAPAGARVIAEVSSPPLPVLLDQMVRDSDNQIAEALIREVALTLSVKDFDVAARTGLPAGWEDSDSFYAVDGSGLATTNTMSAELAARVVADVVVDPDGEIIRRVLPQPGQPGSLERRFEQSDELVIRGVEAKTGSLQGVRSLAGVLDTKPDTVFAIFVTGRGVDDDSRETIDELVGELYACGENLAHWVPKEVDD